MAEEEKTGTLDEWLSNEETEEKEEKDEEKKPEDETAETKEPEKAAEGESSEAAMEEKPAEKKKRKSNPSGRVITVANRAPERSSGDSEADREWQNIRSSLYSKRILSGELAGIERIPLGETVVEIASVVYCGYRIVIPMEQMNIILNGKVETDNRRISRAVSNMIGSEIDFVVTSIDDKERAVVASRKEAMARKIRDYFLRPANENVDEPLIQEGSIVEARVIATAVSAIEVEVFGIDTFISLRKITCRWTPDARSLYSVGDLITVRIEKITRHENGLVTVDVNHASLEEPDEVICAKGGRYLGVVTAASQGIYFLRLKKGQNAIAYEYKGTHPFPKRGDEIAFSCTRMSENNDGSPLAIGIVTRVVRHG